MWLLNKILERIYGKEKFHRIFDRLLYISLRGLNFYNAGKLNFSGEKILIQYLAEKSKNNSTKRVLFDVGASDGLYSKYMFEHFGDKRCEIHLFEPTTACKNIIKKNTKGLPVIFNDAAIGDTQGKVTLHCKNNNPYINSIYDRIRESWKKPFDYDYTETVSMTTIDQYCAESGVENIFYLKLDTEGNEYDCLVGAKSMIEKGGIENIMFEFGGANIDSRTYFYDFWKLLKERYTLYRVLVDGLAPIKKYKNELEVFVAVNYFAELK